MTAQKSISDLNNFARAYVAALYFTDAGDGITNDSELSQSAIEQIEADCAKFELLAHEHSQQAAHDFWLTRNGHGAGFWDGDWPEPQATTLDNIAKRFGQCVAYLGDDGLIYLS